MKLIKDELKEIREKVIGRVLEEMNVGEDIHYKVEGLNVYLFAVNRKAVLILNEDHYLCDMTEQMGIFSGGVIEYKPYDEMYRLHLNAYDEWEIKFISSSNL